MATSPPLVSDISSALASCLPNLLARLTDFSISQVTFAGGDVKKLVSRSPRRNGLIVMVDPAMTTGLAVLPQSFTVAVGTVLPKQTGVIYLTCDLWRGALLSDWYGFNTTGGTATVIDLFNI